MPYSSFAGRWSRFGVEISCIFPECPTHWYLVPARTEEQIRELRVREGWHYVRTVPTSYGLAWGWACSDPTKHFLDGDPSRPYRHPEEISQ